MVLLPECCFSYSRIQLVTSEIGSDRQRLQLQINGGFTKVNLNMNGPSDKPCPALFRSLLLHLTLSQATIPTNGPQWLADIWHISRGLNPLPVGKQGEHTTHQGISTCLMLDTGRLSSCRQYRPASSHLATLPSGHSKHIHVCFPTRWHIPSPDCKPWLTATQTFWS